MAKRDVNFGKLFRNPKSSAAQTAVSDLDATFQQAVALVKTFRDNHYVTVDDLQEILTKQNLPAVDLTQVSAFLLGYLHAEVMSSPFEVAVFGEHSFGEGNEKLIAAALGSLFALMNDKDVSLLEDRTMLPPPPEELEDEDEEDELDLEEDGGETLSSEDLADE